MNKNAKSKANGNNTNKPGVIFFCFQAVGYSDKIRRSRAWFDTVFSFQTRLLQLTRLPANLK